MNKEPFTATQKAVASLLGFRVHVKDDAIGFHLNWMEAMKQGFFDEHVYTVGDYLKAYLRFISLM